MHNDRLNIDQLFKHLEKSETADCGVSWHALKPKVSRFNFFKPGLKVFNVYYASAITVMVASGISAVYINHKTNTEQHIDIIQDTIETKIILVDSLVSDKPNSYVDTFELKADVKQTIGPEEKLSKEKVKERTSKNNENSEEFSESNSLAKPDSITVSDTNRIRNRIKIIKRKKVYVKQDKVVIELDQASVEKNKNSE